MPKKSKMEMLHPASKYGKDEDYLRWLSFQPSCVDGTWNQWDDVGRNIACHVRRIDRGAGCGIKPKFSAIPMTHTQHMNEEDYTIEWRIKQADLHLERWIEHRKLVGKAKK